MYEEVLEIGVTGLDAVMPDGFSWNDHLRQVKEQKQVILEGLVSQMIMLSSGWMNICIITLIMAFSRC